MVKIENRASAVLYKFLKSNVFPNKRFILPANVCPSVPLVFLLSGINFDFVDIDESQHISFQQTIDAIKTGNYDGVLFVHPYGCIYDNVKFYNSLREAKHDIIIIDDRCLTRPEFNDVVDESGISLQLFSTGYSKYVDIGYGGWGIINPMHKYYDIDDLYDAHYETDLFSSVANCLKRDCQLDLDFNKNWIDLSCNLDKCEYFKIVKDKLKEADKQKRIINKIYSSNLHEDIRLGKGQFSEWRYIITLDDRETLLQELKKNNLFAGTNYPNVTNLFGKSHQNTPVASYYSRILVNLFNDFRVNEGMAIKTCEIINKFLKN